MTVVIRNNKVKNDYVGNNVEMSPSIVNQIREDKLKLLGRVLRKKDRIRKNDEENKLRMG